MERQEELSAFDRFVAELQREIDEREREIYSAKVIEAARNPQNLGRMAAPDAQASVRGWCGDTMEVYLQLDGDLIQEATFMTDGCGPSLACGSTLTILVQGLSLEEALQIDPEDVIDALDGLPEDSTHCAELAVTTLQEAVSHWQK